MSHIASAALISPAEDQQAPLLRTEFSVDSGHGAIVSAELEASAQGVFEAYLAGEPVSADVLSPGWTSYEWRLRYRTYNVTTQLRDQPAGPIVLGFALGNGWFRGELTWEMIKDSYGDRLGAIAALTITYEDGHEQVVTTDGSWTSGPSAVLFNDIYGGQKIDARLVSRAWLSAGFTDAAWAPVATLPFDAARLVPYVGPPVIRQEELRPVKVWQSPTGKTLVDFGQNLVGWLKFTVTGERGETITLRHAEVLEDGELGVRPLRNAKATDQLILSGGPDFFEPTFTFHGFRYAEITGWPGEVTSDSLVAVVVSSDLERIGTFACSDPMINQLHHNVVWGQRGNFLDVPTDCPQRDERLGWTGDLAVFSPTAVFLFDSAGFLRDWLRDLDAEQRAADGMVPYVVPDVLKNLPPHPAFGTQDSTAFWSDAAVWVPWAAWQAYGDLEALAEAYPAITAHVRRIEGKLSDRSLWDTGFQFGDWLDPDAPPERAADAKADPSVVSTAAIYRSSVTAAEVARLLGHGDDQVHFDGLAARIRAGFNEAYVSDDGRLHSDCPTVYALAIAFDLLDEPLRQLAGDRLAELARANGYRISTGFAGTPYICDALTATGHLEDAYRLVLEKECPSWLYSVGMGATTIWERWDSMLPDGSINPGEMTSFNHYALGAVADWLHRVVGGLAPASPGYERVRIAPRPGGGLTWAKTSLRTPHGTISVAWEVVDGGLVVDVELPEGVTAELELPGADRETLSGGQSVTRSVAPALSPR
ncbi:MAG TPA: family 78 glycoside hydrolase catalytic domain [Propionibacteriaceae bacterium]